MAQALEFVSSDWSVEDSFSIWTESCGIP